MRSVAPEIPVAGVRPSAETKGLIPPSTPRRQGVFLSDLIIELGLADPTAVEEAVQAAAASNRPIDQVLLETGALDEERLSVAMAERNGLDRVDLDEFDRDPAAARLIGRSVAMRYGALPIAIAQDGALVVAIADPSDFLGINDIEVISRTEVRLVIGEPSAIRALIEDLPDDRAQGQPDSEPMRTAVKIEEVEPDQPEEPAIDAGPTGESNEIERVRQALLEGVEECARLRDAVDRLQAESASASAERQRLAEEVERLSRDRTSSRDAEIADLISLDGEALDERGGTARLSIAVRAPGTVSILGEDVHGESVTVTSPESIDLPVVPTERKQRKLDRIGKTKVQVEITFVSAAGETCVRSRELRLLKRAGVGLRNDEMGTDTAAAGDLAGGQRGADRTG